MVNPGYCTRCSVAQPDGGKILQDILRSPTRSVREISQQIDRYESIEKGAAAQSRKRREQQGERLAEYEEQLKKYEEELALDALDRLLLGEEADQIAEMIVGDRGRRELERMVDSLRNQSEEVDHEDVEQALKEYEQEGLLDMEQGKIRITSRGARVLARQVLGKALENLSRKEVGSHLVRETGYGSELSIHSRRYEPGDQYECVDVQKTLLNALERMASVGQQPWSASQKLSLEPEDFQVCEPLHQTRVCAGVIIDQSGSMQGDFKLQAAMEASLALAELIGKNPRDMLKVFIFSARVEEIHPWDIANVMVGRGSTNMKSAMESYRRAVISARGDKQAYLITDAEPNTVDGAYVGFERAMGEVVQEALHYRESGITLNIIMLDQRPALKEFARVLAQKNLGRVLFATPGNLSTVIVEDYLRVKAKTE